MIIIDIVINGIWIINLMPQQVAGERKYLIMIKLIIAMAISWK